MTKNRTIWQIWSKNANAIQAIATCIGLVTIALPLAAYLLSLRELELEQKKYEIEYGQGIDIEVTDRIFGVKVNKENTTIKNVNLSTKTYLQLSQNPHAPIDVSLIEIDNFLIPEFPDVYVLPDMKDRQLIQPVSLSKFSTIPCKVKSINGQLYGLRYVFNNTPTKFFPSLITIAKVEYSDASKYLQEDYYVYRWNEWETPILMNKAQLEQRLDLQKVIGHINYDRADEYGLASDFFVREMSNILAEKFWHKRFIEPKEVRDYRRNSWDFQKTNCYEA